MNLDDFSYEENGRRYIDPNVSLNEQNAFIQNLRDTQGERNAQIAQQTHNLGTDVPSNLGGLSGSGAYFNARYQTPQTNALIADIKTAAQAQALNDALNNELAKAKKRYGDAYRAAQSRSNSGGNGNGGTNGEIKFETVGDGKEYTLKYKRTEGGDDTNQFGGDNKSSTVRPGLHLLGPNGERIALNMKYGYDSSKGPLGTTRYLETPTVTYEGDKAIREYIERMKAKGYNLYQRLDNGQVITPQMYWSD